MVKKILVILPFLMATTAHSLDFRMKRGFGSWSISKEMFDTIRSIVPDGGTLLEFGSGWTSGEFSKYYTVYSIEHNKKWLNYYNTNYIYAPIKNGWYDAAIVEKKLPADYDLILVDGPPGNIGREKFCDYLYLFNTDVTIILDDVHREAEYKFVTKLAKKLNRPCSITSDSAGKKFAIFSAV